MTADPYVHPQALCESGDVGPASRIWAFAHIMEGAHVGADCNIGGHVFVEDGARIGDGVTVKNMVMVWKRIRIEDGAFIGPGVVFTNDRYARSARLKDVPAITRRYAAEANWILDTCVGAGATIGAGAVILPGLPIGRFATVGAGAVVTAPVGAHELVTGNPARRTGYVGRCGVPLEQPEPDGWRCPESGERYRLGRQGLERVED